MREEGDDFFGDGSSADDAPPDNRSGARQIALQALYSQITKHFGTMMIEPTLLINLTINEKIDSKWL